jgi:hypothetical protein
VTIEEEIGISRFTNDFFEILLEKRGGNNRGSEKIT